MMRVLVVEDARQVASHWARLLEQAGCQVVEPATSVAHALQLAGETPPDVVLVDSHLGGGEDSLAAARELRARWTVPTVLVGAPGQYEELLESGLGCLFS